MQALVEGSPFAVGPVLIQLAQAEPGQPAQPNVVIGPEGAIEHQLDPHEEVEGVFPPFDSSTFASQLLWLAITFTVLYLLMAKVIIPRVGGILEVRRDRIAGDLEMAERLRQQSNEAIAGYEKALADARATAFGLAEKSRLKAKAEADARQAVIEGELDAKLAAAEQRIAAIKAKALADVGDIAADATEAVVARLLGHAPPRAAVRDAVAAARSANA